MVMNHFDAGNWARQNWFFILLPLIFLGDYFVAKTAAPSEVFITEIAVLLDLMVVLPSLYLICYRKSGPKIFVRAIGLMCMGAWLFDHLIPEQDRYFYNYVSWARYAGLAFLALIEIKLLIYMVRLLYSYKRDDHMVVTQISEKMQIPSWAAKLLVMEALFWKRTWKFLSGIFRRH